MRFSANLGFLWADRSLPDAIRAAKAAGFDAVECHWPYDQDAAAVKAALAQTGLAMLGLNTARGNLGENGLCAVPGREDEARASIDEAVAYAVATGTRAIHVMAGFATGEAAQAAFVAALRHACDAFDGTILIEPLNGYDAPGYFLRDVEQAARIIAVVDRPNLRLMFDCYHAQLSGGDVTHRLERLLPLIGHIQIASVPDRGTPDHGELSYAHVFATLDRLGWDRPVGAEYKPVGETDATVAWVTEMADGMDFG